MRYANARVILTSIMTILSDHLICYLHTNQQRCWTWDTGHFLPENKIRKSRRLCVIVQTNESQNIMIMIEWSHNKFFEYFTHTQHTQTHTYKRSTCLNRLWLRCMTRRNMSANKAEYFSFGRWPWPPRAIHPHLIDISNITLLICHHQRKIAIIMHVISIKIDRKCT